MLFFISLALVSTGIFLLLNHGSSKFRPITSYIVIVSHDHQKQIVPTNSATIGALLTKLNIRLNKGDVVEPVVTTPISQDNLRVNIYRAVPVEIIDGGQRTYTLTAASTSRSIAQQAGLTVYPEDNIMTAPTTNFLSDYSIGKQVVINRATPINLNLYGTPTTVHTHAQTVAELIAQKGIKLGEGDSVEPAGTTALTPNLMVYLIHKGTQIVTVQQSIAAPTQIVTDSSLSFGTSAVRQQGTPGQEVLTYQVNTQNGAEIGRTLIQTVVTAQPVTQIVAQGQAVAIPSDKQSVMAEAGISSSDYAYVDYIVSHESGWCPTKVQGQYGGCPGYAPASIPSGLGYGLGQATPGSKMAPFGGDWQTNPVTQLRWATSYADGRYGSWGAAYNHWYNNHNW